MIELIKKAPPEEIKALLNKDITGDSELCKAMIQFRKDWAPRTLLKPCMHYNYASLQHAFEIVSREWNRLKMANNGYYDKINLVWRQLIGFEMRRLTGIDRCIIAQGLCSVIRKKTDCTRSYTFRMSDLDTDFPIIDADDSLDGLGWDFSADIFGRGIEGGPQIGGMGEGWASELKNLCQTKTSNLQNLCSPCQSLNRLGV